MQSKINEAINLLFRRASRVGNFRAWFYPNAPKNYSPNLSVEKEVKILLNQGLSVEETAEKIYDAHRK